MTGVTLALLTPVPFLGLLTPALAALAHTHHGHHWREARRRGRQAMVTVISKQATLNLV